MAGNPFFQDVDPQSPPDQVTPAGGPSSPSNYAGVAVQGMDIQAPSPVGAVTAAFDESIALGGSGVLYPMSERITQAKTLLESPQGFGLGGFNIESGAAAGWPTDMEPPPYETPLHPGPHGG